jgi:hypothetical protein
MQFSDDAKYFWPRESHSHIHHQMPMYWSSTLDGLFIAHVVMPAGVFNGIPAHVLSVRQLWCAWPLITSALGDASDVRKGEMDAFHDRGEQVVLSLALSVADQPPYMLRFVELTISLALAYFWYTGATDTTVGWSPIQRDIEISSENLVSVSLV